MRYEIGQILKKEQVMQLVFGEYSSPKQLLGRHLLKKGQMIAAYHPNAVRMEVLLEEGTTLEMEMIEKQPIFAVFLPHKQLFSYQIKIYFRNGEKKSYHDPYSFPCQITEQEEKAFLQGKWEEAYRKMGSHSTEIDGVQGVYFAVWVPEAKAVSLVGDFNHWDGRICPMNRMEKSQIFEIFLPEIKEGIQYQYEVTTRQGTVVRMADPYGTEIGKNKISKVLNMKKDRWEDEEWMKNRTAFQQEDRAMIFYGVRECSALDEDCLLSGSFTHLLFHQSDRKRKTKQGENISLNRTHFFVPTFLEKNPKEFQTFVEKAHQKKIGVLLEISFGPFHYDKPELVNYLFSALLFWMEYYHIDGFAFKGITTKTEFSPYKFNNINMSSIETAVEIRNRKNMIKQVIEMLREKEKGILLISEEKEAKGTEFDLVWDYEIKENLERYLSQERKYRERNHFRLTLPLQKTVAKHSLLLLDYKNTDDLYQTSIDKLREVYYDMLSEAKLSFAFLIGIPGRKILSNYPENETMRKYLNSLLDLYCRFPALYESEDEKHTFEWVNGMDAPASVLSFIRKSPASQDQFLFLCNFNTMSMRSYQVGVPVYAEYKLLINSDAVEFGGKGQKISRNVLAEKNPCDFRPYSVTVDLPSESVLIFGVGPSFCSME